MAIKSKLIKYASLNKFNADLKKGIISNKSIVFIEDKGRLWTHGNFYDSQWEYLGGKPSKFTPSAHTHVPSDILTDKNNRFVTDVEKGKWNAKLDESVFNDMEIGGRNLLVEATATKGVYLRDSGITTTLSSWAITDFIPVQVGHQYIASGYSNLGTAPATCFYDSDKVFVSGIQNSNANGAPKNDRRRVVTIPAGCAYMRFSFQIVDLGSIKLEKGNKATDYSPAPEDQVTDWNESNVNSLSYLKNRPTTFTPSTHSHGPITNDGKIGTSANRIIETTTGGSLTHVAKKTAYNKAFGTGSGTVAQGNDSRINNGQSAFTRTTNAGITGAYLSNITELDTPPVGARFISSTPSTHSSYPAGMTYPMGIEVGRSGSVSAQLVIGHSNSGTNGNMAFRSKSGASMAPWRSVWDNVNLTKLTQLTNDLPNFNRTVAGLVPAPGAATTTRYLREDGTWVVPPNTGDTHWTTGIRAGASGTNTNSVANDPFIKVLDNTTYRSQVQILGGTNITAKSDATGKITIDGTHNHDTVYVKKIGDTMTGALTATSFVKSGVTTPQNYLLQADGGHILKSSFSGSTHNHTLKLIAGASTATTNPTADVANPYIRLFSDTVHQGSIRIVGGTNVGAVSKAGTITLTATDTKYTTGTLAQLNAGTDKTGRLQTAKLLNDWLNPKLALKLDTSTFNAMEIGGRNLLNNSGNFTNTDGWRNYTGAGSTLELVGDRIVFKGITGSPRLMNTATTFYNTDPAQEHTISVEYVGVISSISGKHNGSGSTQNIGSVSLVKTIDLGEGVKRSVYRWIPRTKSSVDTSFFMYLFVPVNTVLELINIKVEKGNISTAWGPSFEDQISDWNQTNERAFDFIKNKPTKLSQFSNDLGNYGSWITKAQGDGYYAPKSHTHSYLPLTGGTLTGSSYNILELKRSSANGSSVLFSNSSVNLGKIGFVANGGLVIGTGTTTDGVADMLSITSSGVAQFYGNISTSGLITGTGFSKTGATDAHVLLGSGGHKAITDFNTSLVTSTTTSGISNVATSNTNTYLNVVQGGVSSGSSTQIMGSNGVSVSSNTSGRVTITGVGNFRDYGLGRNTALNINLADGKTETGLYTSNTSDSNSPMSGSSGAVLNLWSAVSNGANAQIWMKANNTSGEDVYVRHSNNAGVFYPWQRLWHSGDFTQTDITKWNTAYVPKQWTGAGDGAEIWMKSDVTTAGHSLGLHFTNSTNSTTATYQSRIQSRRGSGNYSDLIFAIRDTDIMLEILGQDRRVNILNKLTVQNNEVYHTGNIPTWNQSTTGNAKTASAVSTSAENSSTASRYILFANSANGNQALKTDSGLKYVPSTNTISANFAGNLTGLASLNLPLTGGILTGDIQYGTDTGNGSYFFGTTSGTNGYGSWMTQNIKKVNGVLVKPRGTLASKALTINHHKGMSLFVDNRTGLAHGVTAELSQVFNVSTAGVITAASFSGNINASNLNTGTVPNARISGTYTGLTSLTGTGNVDFARFIGNAGDTVAAPSITWTGDLNTGIYRPGASQVAITTGGVQRALFNSAGITGTLVGNASTATLASTLTINSSASASWFDILWNSGTTVYGSASNKLRVQPSTGSITSSGTITASGGNSNQWNSAYSWGNHAGMYSSRANGLGASSNSIEAKDTRSINPLPNTDLQRGVWFDFKSSSAIGLTGASTYSSVITMVPYGDNSGNSNTSFRLAQSGNNLHFQNWTTVWGTWNKLWHSGNLANGTTSQYIRGDGSLATYANTTYSAGTLALLQTGTNTSNRVWSAKILTDFTDGKYLGLAGGTITGALTIKSSANAGKDVLLTLGRSSAGYGDTQFSQSYDNRYYSNGKTLDIDLHNTTYLSLAGSNNTATGKIVAHKPIEYLTGTSDNWNTAYTYSQVGHLPLSGGIITGGSYNMLTLARSNANGSSILFKNSAGNLGKLGFASNGVFHLGNGASTDGVGNLLQITSTGNITAYGNINASGKTITATTFSGTATNATNINTLADNSSNASRFILFSDAAAGNQRAKTDTGLKYNPSSNTITATLSGNASSATKLKNSRTIWGQSFNGTANVSGALTGATTITASTSVSTPHVSNGDVYIRHTSGSNTIISSESAGMIYLRPNGDSNSSNQITINGSGVLSLPSLTASTSVTAPTGSFSSTLSANRIVVTSTSNVKHLEFSRSDYNYITSKGHIGLVTGGTATGSANQQVWIHSNGNTKIGAGSSSAPAYTLDVNGTGRFTGNVTSSSFIGSLSGNASSATKLANINTTFTGTYPATFNVNGTIYSHTGIKFTGSTGTLSATNFSGNLTGTASGNIPYSGANKPIDTNNQTLIIGGELRKLASIFEWNQRTGLSFNKYTDVASYGLGNVSETRDIIITIPVTTTTVWHAEIDFFRETQYHKLRVGAYNTSNTSRYVITEGDSPIEQVKFCRYNGYTVIIVKDINVRRLQVNLTNVWRHHTNGAAFNSKNNYNIEFDYEANLSGLVVTATINKNNFKSSRTINGTLFDGTANITTANWGTARNISIGGTSKSVNGSGNVTWAASEIAANTATRLATARTLTIGNKGKTFNGSANVSWTLAEIGAAPASHTHSGHDVKTLGHRLTVDSDGKVRVNHSSYRRAGMYGIYDSNKIGHIWSMGNSYQIAADGANFGNLYGLAYKHTNNSTGGTMGGGHQVVWATNGNPTVSLGSNVWTSGGFLKNGSSNSYALLGGGGHTALSNLTNNTGIRVGASGTAANTAVTSPYIKVVDNEAYREQFRLIGGSNVTITSDASKNITITAVSSDNVKQSIASNSVFRPVLFANTTGANTPGASYVHTTVTGETHYSSGLRVNMSNGDMISSGKINSSGFYQTSDIRLKNVIRNVDITRQDIESIPTFYFKYKNSNKVDIGTSAQEVKKIFPELVAENPVDGTLTVQYDKFGVIALEMIKSQYKELDKLRREVELLKSKYNGR